MATPSPAPLEPSLRPSSSSSRSTGRWGSARTDNGLESVNEDLQTSLAEVGIKRRELTPVDGVKRNERTERKLALIAEGAKAASLELPRHFSDFQFPREALSWQAIWPERRVPG